MNQESLQQEIQSAIAYTSNCFICLNKWGGSDHHWFTWAQTTWTQPISLPKKMLSNDQRTSHTDTVRYTTSDALQSSGFLLQVLKVPCQHGNWKKRERKKEDIKWTSFSGQVCPIQDSILYILFRTSMSYSRLYIIQDCFMDLTAVGFFQETENLLKNTQKSAEHSHTEQIYYLRFCCFVAWTEVCLSWWCKWQCSKWLTFSPGSVYQGLNGVHELLSMLFQVVHMMLAGR